MCFKLTDSFHNAGTASRMLSDALCCAGGLTGNTSSPANSYKLTANLSLFKYIRYVGNTVKIMALLLTTVLFLQRTRVSNFFKKYVGCDSEILSVLM